MLSGNYAFARRRHDPMMLMPPFLFEIHARSALENGEIQYEELEEFRLVLVNYCGYPRVAPLSVLSRELIAERDKREST